MKRTVAILIAIAIPVAASIAADMPAEPTAVTNYGKKAPVVFDHAKHAGGGLECASCHHTADTGQYKCGECHKLETENGAPPIKEAMHGKGTGVCYTCHLQKEAQNKMKCAECHVK